MWSVFGKKGEKVTEKRFECAQPGKRPGAFYADLFRRKVRGADKNRDAQPELLKKCGNVLKFLWILMSREKGSEDGGE